MLASAIVSRVRLATDLQSSTLKPTDLEILQFINNGLAELHTIIASGASSSDKLMVSTPLICSSSLFPSASYPADFMKHKAIETSKNGYVQALDRCSVQDREKLEYQSGTASATVPSYFFKKNFYQFSPAAAAADTYTLWYIPVYAPLANTSSVVDPIYQQNDFEEYVVQSASFATLLAMGNRANDAKNCYQSMKDLKDKITKDCSKIDMSGRAKGVRRIEDELGTNMSMCPRTYSY